MTISPQAAQTREALLRAGRAEFAEHGLAGARTDRIATLAGINKQRIYAYFGNKEGLFTAVIADALDELLDVIPLPTGGSRAEKMAEYVTSVAAFHRAHPELLRLLQWEALQLGSGAELNEERTRKYADKVTTFADALDFDRAQAAHVLLATIGLAAWPVAMPQLTRLILDHDLDTALDKTTTWAASIAASFISG
ncbi:TetR/AcrR family transcriptional regulator [Brevibacterium casei]|uniref:TetR/AcrR family transcriptional regulator n=1 Tax=Brevibacterium casei TaxID=33889 RepID=UPI003F7D0040